MNIRYTSATIIGSMVLSAAALAQTQLQPGPMVETVGKRVEQPAPHKDKDAPLLSPFSAKHGQPQAKTKEEFAAYQAVTTTADPAAALKAADDFAQKYPQSDLRYILYSQLLQKAYAGNQADSVIDIGHKVLVIEPDDALALIMVATTLSETTHDTDLDKDEKFSEAMKDADKGIKNITAGTGIVVMPQMDPERLAKAKRELTAMGHASMGYIELNRQNYGLSEQHFKDAIAANPQRPDETNYMRLAVAQDKQAHYVDAMASSDKAMQLAQADNNSSVADLAKNEKDRLTKLMASAPKAATTTPPPK